MKTYRLKRICAMLVVVLAFCPGSAAPMNGHADGPVMLKSSLSVVPPPSDERIVDVLDKKAKEPGELIGKPTNTTAPVAGGTEQNQTNQNQTNQNQTTQAVQNQTASDTLGTGPAGTEQPNIGPSMMSQIVTQGELGAAKEVMLGGAKLMMFQSQTDKQILSCIIQTSKGKLIVIDGGYGADAPNLLNQLWARGGHVGAWLVTHPHADHVGALFEVLEFPERNLTIDGIYYSMANPSWYSQRDAKDSEMAHALINTLSQMPAEMLHGDIARGTEIMVDDVKIEVMNDRYDLYQDSGNNATIVYKVTVNGKSILFLGDMGEEGGKKLLADCGDSLKSDMVQMAHHGQNGVGKAVYQAINPSICLWPTPQWLWDNNNGGGVNSGGWQTAATKGWMNSINPDIKHYVTKDGDLTIE